jgi:hypothetical protein
VSRSGGPAKAGERRELGRAATATKRKALIIPRLFVLRNWIATPKFSFCTSGVPGYIAGMTSSPRDALRLALFAAIVGSLPGLWIVWGMTMDALHGGFTWIAWWVLPVAAAYFLVLIASAIISFLALRSSK